MTKSTQPLTASKAAMSLSSSPSCLLSTSACPMTHHLLNIIHQHTTSHWLHDPLCSVGSPGPLFASPLSFWTGRAGLRKRPKDMATIYDIHGMWHSSPASYCNSSAYTMAAFSQKWEWEFFTSRSPETAVAKRV